MKLRLGELTFDGNARQLLRGRQEVHLSPKAFELLRVLIDERPRALSKAELHRRLWPDTFVSDTNLATSVGEIREALGDTAKGPRFIRTAQRFGYAFSGDVADAGLGGGEPDDAASHDDSTRFCWLINNGKRLPLQPGENVLGRDPDGGIRLDSPTVSRRHARISISASGVLLEDLDSKNGTRLRGKAVSSPVALADGDEIRVGSVVLRFRMASGSRTTTWTDS